MGSQGVRSMSVTGFDQAFLTERGGVRNGKRFRSPSSAFKRVIVECVTKYSLLKDIFFTGMHLLTDI